MANLLLMDIDGGGGGSSLLDSDGGGASVAFVPQSPVSSPAAISSSPSSSAGFDLSPTSIAAARARGNVESDVRSAYQTFLTGVPTGRGGQYAIDAQRRFGYASITDAAAAYLDAAGLRRLLIEDEEIAELEFGGGDFFGLPPLDPEPLPNTKGVVTDEGPEGPGNPFATIGDLADMFERFFAVREPETTSPVVVVGDSTQAEQGSGGGGAGLGLILLVLAIGGGAFYWFYWRNRNAG